MAEAFDVVVIGAGPGGYTAAIRAAQLGFKTACVDDWKTGDGKPAPGGTCTNVGCIPSKAVLQSSEHYAHAGHAFADHGIEIKGLGLDLKQMQARKAKVVRQNNEGILYLFKKNKIAFYSGCARFAGGSSVGSSGESTRGADGWTIEVSGSGNPTLRAKHVIVATGSPPGAAPGGRLHQRTIPRHHGRGGTTSC